MEQNNKPQLSDDKRIPAARDAEKEERYEH